MVSIIRPTSGLSPPAHFPSTAKIALRNGRKANEGQMAKRRENGNPQQPAKQVLSHLLKVSQRLVSFSKIKKHNSPSLHFLLQGNKKSMRETCSPSTVIWFPLLMHVFFLTEARGGGILDYHHIRLVIYLFPFISISISGRHCRLHIWQPLVR